MRRIRTTVLLALAMLALVPPSPAAAGSPPEVRTAGEEVPAPFPPAAAPGPAAVPGRATLDLPGELREERAGAWEWAYLVSGQGRGNIIYVSSSVPLYEHQLHLYVPTQSTAAFVVYRGPSLTGTYTLVDEVFQTLEPGNRFYTSGPRDLELEAGWYYYLGASWPDTAIYARANALPPQALSFGTVMTSVPQNLPGYPPAPQGTNSSTGYPPAHQAIITGLPPGDGTPGFPTELLVTSTPGLLGAELDWINPVYRTDGGALTALDGVRIYRDRELIEVLDGMEIGMPVMWIDTSVRRAGCQTYRVAGFNGEGCGWGQEQRLWIGAGTGVYDWAAIPYEWMEISALGTDTGITGDDQSAGPFAIGFSFPFYGDTYDALRISANGFISLTSFASPPVNARIPDPAGPNALVAPYWDDLNPAGRGEIYTCLDPAGPRFIVEWHDLPCWGTLEGHYTFQAILHPDGVIDFVYRELTAGVPDAATAGIEDPSGMNGLELCYCLDGACRPEPESAVRFAPRLSPASTGNGQAATAPLRLGWPEPNPSSAEVRVRIDLARDACLDARVLDAAGRLVRVLRRGPASQGPQTVAWDGRLGDGTEAPAGVYFLRAGGPEAGSRRIVRIR